jgi:hypothetical protein
MDAISEISIDRLVLDIPGLTPDQGKQVAQHVASGLAASQAPRDSKPGEHRRLAVELEAILAGDSPERLANSIVTAILRQIG